MFFFLFKDEDYEKDDKSTIYIECELMLENST